MSPVAPVSRKPFGQGSGHALQGSREDAALAHLKALDCVPRYLTPLKLDKGGDENRDYVLNGHRQDCNNNFNICTLR
jgi:hypothetical protein